MTHRWAGRELRRTAQTGQFRSTSPVIGRWLPPPYGAAMATGVWPDLAALPGVGHAVEGARSAITALRGHPANRKRRSGTAAAAMVRAARASAALDGAPLELDADSTAVADPVLAGALRVATAIGSLALIWPRSPMQVLARLHTLAAADLAPAQELGRPQTGGVNLGVRLSGFSEMVTAAPWPAPVRVAVVHGELLALHLFGSA